MRRIALVTLIVSLLALPGGLGRADTPVTQGDEKSGSAAGSTKGPDGHANEPAEKKDMFGRSLDLAIWTWVVFILLFLILRKYAWKPMLDGLRKRELNIAKAIEDAEKAREETKALHATLEARMNQASQQVSEMLAEARRDAESTKAEMIAEARGEIQADRERLQREVLMARDQALQEIWKQAAQLATLVSTKAIRKQLSLEDHRRLVDEALSEMKGAVAEAREFVRTGRT